VVVVFVVVELLLWFVELSPNMVLRNMYWCFVIAVVWYTVIHFGIVTGYTTTHTTTTTRTAIARHHHHHHHRHHHRRRLPPVTMTPTIIAATSLSSLRRTSGWTHATIAAATMLLMRPRNSILASNSHAEDADTDVDPNDAVTLQQQQQPRIVYDLGIGPASVSDTHDHDADINNSTTTSSGTTIVNSPASVVGMHWMAPAAVVKPVPNHDNQKNHHRPPVPPLAAATATETNSYHKKSRRMVAYVYIVLCVCVCVCSVCVNTLHVLTHGREFLVQSFCLVVALWLSTCTYITHQKYYIYIPIMIGMMMVMIQS
jgi:hypothetical protein